MEILYFLLAGDFKNVSHKYFTQAATERISDIQLRQMVLRHNLVSALISVAGLRNMCFFKEVYKNY